MFHIFYSTYADALVYQGLSCRGFTLLLQLIKSKNCIFASTGANVQFITFTQMIFGYNGTFVKQADSSLLFPLLMKALERCVSSGSTLSIHSPFWKSTHIWRYKDILSRKSSHKDASISVIFWTVNE